MTKETIDTTSEGLSEALKQVEDERVRQMLLDLAESPRIYQPSRFWDYYLNVHIQHIDATGIAKFKRTVNLNYFNWTIHRIFEQKEHLQRLLLIHETSCSESALPQVSRTSNKPNEWSDSQWEEYVHFLQLWILYARKMDLFELLKGIDEPFAGDPLAACIEGQWISQDLCNSTLEANSFLQSLKAEFDVQQLEKRKLHLAELGAGYGRFTYLWRKRFPQHKMTIFDIPPALRISEWYLSEIFKDAKIFRYRKFDDFRSIEEEYRQSDIAFFLPHQIELFPDDIFDLFVNISSLHEMTHTQIKLWMSHIDRLCTGHFYSKQWFESVNKYDDIKVGLEDYPIAERWRTLFLQSCDVQPKFFEACYATRKEKSQ